MLVVGEVMGPPFEQTRAKERAVLAEAGAELVLAASIEEFRELAPRADGVLNNHFRLREPELALLGHCRCIAHHAVGVDMIDTAEAARLGIVVANVPSYGPDDVADQAMMLLLASARKFLLQETIVAKDRWDIGELVPIHRLRGRTLGILAVGRIGSQMAKRGQAFGLHVIACDPYADPAALAANGIEPVPFDQLLERSDYLSIHAPLTPETRGMIDAEALARMKQGAIIINCARGPIIDEAALIAALASGQIGAAGLDVFAHEPLALDDPIRTAPRTILTPHAAFYSESSIESMQVEAARDVAATLRGEIPPHPVNLPGIDWGHAYRRWNLRPAAS